MVHPRPHWLIGAVENPFAAPQRFRAHRLAKKVAAGAEFVQTQYVFDIDMFERWMADVRELGLPARELITQAGGPLPGDRVAAVLPGGYSLPWLRGDQLDVTLDAESLKAVGTGLGASVIVMLRSVRP